MPNNPWSPVNHAGQQQSQLIGTRHGVGVQFDKEGFGQVVATFERRRQEYLQAIYVRMALRETRHGFEQMLNDLVRAADASRDAIVSRVTRDLDREVRLFMNEVSLETNERGFIDLPEEVLEDATAMRARFDKAADRRIEFGQASRKLNKARAQGANSVVKHFIKQKQKQAAKSVRKSEEKYQAKLVGYEQMVEGHIRQIIEALRECAPVPRMVQVCRQLADRLQFLGFRHDQVQVVRNWGEGLFLMIAERMPDRYLDDPARLTELGRD